MAEEHFMVVICAMCFVGKTGDEKYRQGVVLKQSRLQRLPLP